MLRLSEITAALKTLIGWRQSYDPARQIEDSLTRSDTGMYYQDAHPMLTLDNIEAVMPDNYSARYPLFDTSKEYASGDIVRNGDKVFYADDPVAGMPPAATNSGWHVYNPLTDYLQETTEAGIARLMQKYSTTKRVMQESSALVRQEALVLSPNRAKNAIAPTNKLVGFTFKIVRSQGVSVKIPKIGLQMTGATGTVKLYLFHTSQFEPIKTFEVEIDGSQAGFVWISPEDLYLTQPYKGTGLNGEYYICYNQSDLPEYMRAVNSNRDWERRPCGTCNQGNPHLWDTLEKIVKVRPFQAIIDDDFADNPTLPDTDGMSCEPTFSYGFNFVVEAGCDLTDFIINQKSAFANALQLEVASDMLRRIALNPSVRVNRNQLNATRDEVLYEIDGDTQGTRATGLNAALKAAYKAIEIDTQGIDRICLSCNNRGVRYTQV